MTPPPNMEEVHLGTMKLDYIGALILRFDQHKAYPSLTLCISLSNRLLTLTGAAAGHGRIKQATRFEIVNEEAFGEFSKFLVTQEEFTWRLTCDSVHVKAFSFFPTYKNLDFSKHVVFKGLNNLDGIKILDFQLPGDDPRGGITVQALSSIENPSAFSVQIGSLYLDLYYKNVFLGPVETHGLNLSS